MSETATLQINDRGSWRNVAAFEVTKAQAVMAAARGLAEAIGGRATWRIAQAEAGRSPRVLATQEQILAAERIKARQPGAVTAVWNSGAVQPGRATSALIAIPFEDEGVYLLPELYEFLPSKRRWRTVDGDRTLEHEHFLWMSEENIAPDRLIELLCEGVVS